MTAKLSDEEKAAKAAAKKAAKDAKNETPEATSEVMETPVDEDGNPVQLYTQEDVDQLVEAGVAAAGDALEEKVEAAYNEGHAAGAASVKAGPSGKPAKQCTDGMKVKVGDSVRFWHPKNGGVDELIAAEVSQVLKNPKGAPNLTLKYQTQAGIQTRAGVRYLSDPTMVERTGRWLEYGRAPVKPEKPKG